MKQSLFQTGDYTLHSGQKSEWKIECDALTDTDYETLARIVVKDWELQFGMVTYVGHKIKEGELSNSYKFARALKPFATRTVGDLILIVDDVLTTGQSMEYTKQLLEKNCGKDKKYKGVVIFSRGECPKWVSTIFSWHSGI